MTYMEFIFIIGDNTGADELGQSFTPKMTETTMPKRGGCSDESGGAGGRWEEWVEVARAIAPGDHVPGVQILHRKAKGIKFNGTIIWRHQNIIKSKITMRKRKDV
jgi:hypothetical protein